MPKLTLSPALVRSATCLSGKAKTDYFDTQQTGLLLEVRSSGGKTFYQRYTDRSGKVRQYKLGDATIITLGQARAEGRRLVQQALLGDSPQATRQAQRGTPTLSEFFEQRLLPHWQRRRRSWRDAETAFRKHILPKLGQLKGPDITTAVVTNLISDLRARGYAEGTTNRIRSLLYSAFTLGARWKVSGFDGENVVAEVPAAPQVFRERYLTDEELDRLVAAIRVERTQTAAAAITIMLLTGARKREITHARWEHVDLDQKRLTVPVSKNGQPRHIVLSPPAVEILKAMIPRRGDNPWVFPSRITGRPCPTMNFQWDRIRERAGLPGLRMHDLRHSFASFLVNKGYSLYVVQGLLGHKNPKTTQRYAHLAPKTLQEAADFVAGMVGAGMAGQKHTIAVTDADESEPA